MDRTQHCPVPDWRTEIQDLAAIGDDVVVRVISTGTHKGVGKIPVNGGLLVNVPPSGNTFKVQSIHWYTLKDSLIDFSAFQNQTTPAKQN